MRLQLWAPIAGLALVAIAHQASAQTALGTVTVCYYSAECAFANIPGIMHPPNEAQKLRDSGEHQGTHPLTSGTPVDAPAFQFTNTGTVKITGAAFTIERSTSLKIVKDTFHIGTIKPGKSFVIVPGASNDKKTHPSGGFFTFNSPGSPLDTSDSGPDDNTIEFKFTGRSGGKDVTSGIIEPGDSLSPSVDGTVNSLNFLGGPGNADGPCNDCYGSKVIANITIAATDTAKR
jgi:hypothetical protein